MMQSVTSRPVACASCDLADICRLRSIDQERIPKHCRSPEPIRSLSQGAYLFRAGGRAQYLYAVRHGAFKTVTVSADGEEQVLGFHLPGDALALDAIHEGRHRHDVIALTDSSCCAVPLTRFADQCARLPSLAMATMQLLSREIAEQSARLDVARGPARRRVLGLLLDLGARMQRRGFNGTELRLGMYRRDIASFLDTRIETVSRMLRRLQREGVIGLHGRQISLAARRLLEELPAN